MLEIDVEAAVNLTNKVDELNQRLARMERERPRTLKLPVGLSSVQANVVVGGPVQGRQWQIRRVQLDGVTNSLGGSPLTAAGSVTNPGASAIIANTPGSGGTPAGYYNLQVTVGYGSTPGTVANNFRIVTSPATTTETIGAPLIANGSQTFTFPSFYTPGQIIVRAGTADTGAGGIYNASIIATPTGLGPVLMYSDESFSQASLLWEFASSPVSETFGRDEMTLVFPEVLVIDTTQSGVALAGSVQVIDMPAGEYVR